SRRRRELAWFARFRSSAAVGFAGFANPGGGGGAFPGSSPPRPAAPRPPVSRSSLPPSYAVVTTDRGATNDGNALLSELEHAAVTARNESTMRFDTAPPQGTAAP